MSTLDELAELARRAFWMGWAASAGPATPRVMAACHAACEAAAAHPDDGPYPMLMIGQLEGTWAAIFTRREELLTRVLAEIRASFRPALGRLDLPALIRRVADHTSGEKVTPDDLAAVRAAALAFTHQMAEDGDWSKLRYILGQGLRSAHAEGATDALASMAADLGAPVPAADFASGFEHMYRALGRYGEDEQAHGGAWLARALDGTGNRLGNRLAAIARDGGDYDAMLDGAAEVLDASLDLELIVDDALVTGLSDGAIDLYSQLNVAQTSWITAGDGRVCQLCDTNATGSPYTLLDKPAMPAHPLCRCVWVAAGVSLPGSVFATFGMPLVSRLLK